ncbi:TadE/TadG family type IV pilus assembly protein [Gluconacetobacter takamatsuzukensis]|uniref:Putative Flp pilus-assembly TadG-like N-terminal domain-containing protein n=1 Tax=Gluconacetobacter takamatsuzukensis TaxID=1286190 RepID=A0A7W4PNX0_9PROT|nr:pilus assembly protein TadG-related protein [Gluconacetobacter takamatsuzukensis]MBB2204790.1 hypothetical protein [Gluconacetobacter takamatsuzukensis]
MPQRTFLRGLRNDRRGGVLLIFAFAAIPLIFAVGMAIDYSRAMKTRTKLDAIADAAALYAVSAPMMELSDADAQTEATALFCSQAEKQTGTADQADESCSQIRSLPNASDFKLDSLTVTSSTSAGKRVASVSYVAESPNAFATVLGRPTLTVRGESDTTNSIAPNMDFYFLLDTSMSMAYPTTTDGLIAVAGYNNSGCRFACHYSSFTKGKADPYMWAISQSSFDLRIDAEGKAVSQLFTLAESMASKNNTIYRMNISTYGTANTAYTFTNLQKTDTIDNVQANYSTKVSPYIVPPPVCFRQQPGQRQSAPVGGQRYDDRRGPLQHAAKRPAPAGRNRDQRRYAASSPVHRHGRHERRTQPQWRLHPAYQRIAHIQADRPARSLSVRQDQGARHQDRDPLYRIYPGLPDWRFMVGQ